MYGFHVGHLIQVAKVESESDQLVGYIRSIDWKKRATVLGGYPEHRTLRRFSPPGRSLETVDIPELTPAVMETIRDERLRRILEEIRDEIGRATDG